MGGRTCGNNSQTIKHATIQALPELFAKQAIIFCLAVIFYHVNYFKDDTAAGLLRLNGMAVSGERASSLCLRLSRVDEKSGLLIKFFM